MKIVYAMCSPRQLDFYLTDRREDVPSGATVFAICTGERTIENQDEDLFSAITDEEYFALRAMVSEAEQLEAKRKTVAATAPTVVQSLRQLFRQLSATLFGKSAKGRRGSRKFPACSAGTVAPVRL